MKYIPNGALLGVFMFMGFSSIPGNQLFDRMFLWGKFDPRTYPRLPYVTRMPTGRLHKFTFIQVICLAILYALKAVKSTAMVFPFFIALLVFVSKGLGKFFSQEELEVLDAEEDLPPDAQPKETETNAKDATPQESAMPKPEKETVKAGVVDNNCEMNHGDEWLNGNKLERKI